MKFSLTLALASIAILVCFSTPTEALTRGSLRCSPGYYIFDRVNVVDCPDQSFPGTPLRGKGTCCSCPFGSFSNGRVCRRCTDAKTADHGVDTRKWGSQCSCIEGFGDWDKDTLTCRRCPANTRSFNNKCVKCDAGSWSKAQSSTCNAVMCPADSFLPPGGSQLGDCVRCKFGTARQNCGNVESCRCLVGYAAFNRLTGECRQCPGNSIEVYDETVIPRDPTKTKCAPCERATIASANRRVCVPVNGAPVDVLPFPAQVIDQVPVETCDPMSSSSSGSGGPI